MHIKAFKSISTEILCSKPCGNFVTNLTRHNRNRRISIFDFGDTWKFNSFKSNNQIRHFGVENNVIRIIFSCLTLLAKRRDIALITAIPVRKTG